MRGCLDDDAIAAYAEGELSPEARARAERHLGRCNDCALLLAEYARFLFQPREPQGDTAPRGADAQPPGTVIGRYTVVGLLGAGGAGAVYEAFDPQLKRKVALKLLRRPLSPPGSRVEDEVQALLHEAEAMAKLSHPNVVAVHDAGLFEGLVFIVMELVEGETLAAWLHAAPRPPAEIVARFVAAGRGVEAAHRAGLIHGDFKPQNVLVGRDGRVRVTDFGLSRGSAKEHRRAPFLAGGTPFYMAPEQFRREHATLASDQFSFALSLYRALCRRDPFGVQARSSWSVGQKAGALSGRHLRAAGLPRRARRALLCALALDPAQRLPSLGALLDVIEAGSWPGRARPWRSPRVALGVATCVVLGGLALGAWRARAPHPPICGNGLVEPGEDCDDGGKSSACAMCRVCGGGAASFVWRENRHCYTVHLDPRTWDESQSFCQARGGTLVGYGTGAEAVEVSAALLRPGTPGLWLGLRRWRAESGFQWSTGERWSEPIEAWWFDVEKRPDGDCVFQIDGEPRRNIPLRARWPTSRCDERRPFVCESAPWTVGGPEGHAYRSYAQKVEWEVARGACEGQGAHLAVITSAEEQAFVASLVTLSGWIGLQAPRAAGPFTWTTREPFRFKAFSVNEPDAVETPVCTVLATDRLWHDRGCLHRNGYVCERP